MKPFNRRPFLVGATALAAALVLSACGGSGSANVSGAIKVGVVLPLTGNLSALGNEMNNGYLVAQELFNEAGGVNGRDVEFVTSDAPSPEDAVSVATKLSTDASVAAIMGSYSSGIAIPASEVANRNKKPYWETGGAADEITDRGLEYLFRTSGTASQPQTSAMTADFFQNTISKAMGKDMSEVKIGIAHEDSAFGVSSAASFKKIADENGWNVVAEQPYTATTSDLSSVVQNLKTSQVEVLYSAAYVNDAILLMNQSAELGFDPAVVLGYGAGYTTPDIVNALGDRVNGIVAMDGAPIGIQDDLLPENPTPSYSEFVERYESKFDRAPLVHATIGYVGAMTLFQEVLSKMTDPLDGEEFLEVARKVDIAPGGTASYFGVKFDDKGQNERAMTFLMQYSDKKMVTIYPENVAAKDFELR
ncbi:ABC transporter substrate-binding protein [Paeniglutamicibacter sulfureus]|uniref:ABC transporter substrate-binding protein n=1 Tax=Paeniglutamicibacter sulfureus TaxID=43666 RepID=UPI002666CB4D|nr:ABC transporter substrate-binding protein [Paeniglutamicibacter sulfureus]MDO2934662.1 ABC transporter substrate-binding protein [Paeniglutamicibacter sulfureus]